MRKWQITNKTLGVNYEGEDLGKLLENVKADLKAGYVMTARLLPEQPVDSIDKMLKETSIIISQQGAYTDWLTLIRNFAKAYDPTLPMTKKLAIEMCTVIINDFYNEGGER